MKENYFKEIKGDKFNNKNKNQFQYNKSEQKTQNKNENNLKRPKSAGLIKKAVDLVYVGNIKIIPDITKDDKEKALEIRKNLHTFLNQRKEIFISNNKEECINQINSYKDSDKNDNKNINNLNNYIMHRHNFS